MEYKDLEEFKNSGICEDYRWITILDNISATADFGLGKIFHYSSEYEKDDEIKVLVWEELICEMYIDWKAQYSGLKVLMYNCKKFWVVSVTDKEYGYKDILICFNM